MRLTKLSDYGMVVWTDEALYNGKIDREKIIGRLYELEEEEEKRGEEEKIYEEGKGQVDE